MGRIFGPANLKSTAGPRAMTKLNLPLWDFKKGQEQSFADPALPYHGYNLVWKNHGCRSVAGTLAGSSRDDDLSYGAASAVLIFLK